MILERFRLDGQVAVVTGAGRGIGAASALAEAGADVVVSSRTDEDLRRVAEGIEARGRRAEVVVADLDDTTAADRLVAMATSLGRLGVVVNNVGGTMPRALLDTSDGFLERAFHFNVTTAVALTRAATTPMLESGGGSVINISSVLGRVPGRGYLAYGTAKAALAHATRLLAADLDDRLGDAIEDLCRLLRAGIDVVSSSPVFLQFPAGAAETMAQPVREAARAGGASLFVNGVDPGFANDALPLTITGVCERTDAVRCMEVLNYSTYDQGKVLFEIMGFGRPLDDLPMLLQPGVLSLAWGSVLHQLAAGLGVTLEHIEESHERLPAPADIEVDSGTIPKGTAAALRFELAGVVDGTRRLFLEHVTRTHDDLARDWPQPAGAGCYRVVVSGSPSYTVDLQLLGEDGDHNTAGLQATAMRLVNAVPHVVAADPGIVTALDLPMVTGRGLLA
jgi:2,4-diaminopentanoate dehydrogenase